SFTQRGASPAHGLGQPRMTFAQAGREQKLDGGAEICVGRLDVSVDDAFVVCSLERVGYLNAEDSRLWDCQTVADWGALYSDFGGSGFQLAITNSGAVAAPTGSFTRKRLPVTTSYSAPSGSWNKATGLPKRCCLRSTTG